MCRAEGLVVHGDAISAVYSCSLLSCLDIFCRLSNLYSWNVTTENLRVDPFPTVHAGFRFMRP